jgi:hypothetical protein
MSMQRPAEQEVLLTPAEVAKMFRVDPKTVTRLESSQQLEPLAAIVAIEDQRFKRY